MLKANWITIQLSSDSYKFNIIVYFWLGAISHTLCIYNGIHISHVFLPHLLYIHLFINCETKTNKLKNNDSLHFCTTEIYVPQEYFRMCYIRRQLMFCCDHVVDDVRGWHMTSWKLEFIILPRPSFGARCPRQVLSPGLYLCWGLVLWIWFGWLPKPDEKILFDSLSSTFTPVQSISWPPLRTTCSLTADFELAALDLCSERRFPNFLPDSPI